ncbi:MAG TPA: HlyC/CorC family transporter [Vicinamibacterales bacterium]|nr:HlyC/CorC family transporter [Vicinamibacterales bacterium]
MARHIWITLGGIFVLLTVSAFLSGAETALTVASRARMQHLERKGNRRAAIVRRLREDREILAGAVLLGATLSNVLAAALATSLAVGLFGAAGIAYATVAAALAILIFAEVMPRTLAFNHADRTALAAAPLLERVVRALRPAVLLIRFAVRQMLRLFGEPAEATYSHEARIEELRGAIEQHRGEEREIRDERRMLRSVLDLGTVWVSEIMTHRRNMVTIDGGLPPREIVEQVLNSPYTRIPVWLDHPDNIIGVIHAKALLRAVQAQGGNLQELDVRAIAAPAWFIPDSTTLLDQLQAFRRRREHFALVVDEYGALMGLVTLEDILEEIVGDISDEHDVTMPGVRAQPDGSYIVAGTVTIRDLNREFEWNLPDEEAATIAGLLLREARQIPDAGQTFDFYGFRFSVLRRVRNQITSIRITPPRRDTPVA